MENCFNLLWGFRNSIGVLEKVEEILNNYDKEIFEQRRRELIESKIDLTSYLVWFIENYPERIKVMKDNPDYQLRFK